MSLKEYNKKRNFNKTNEPKGIKKPSKTYKFVIQYHQARAKHYDFRLEYNGVLLSWAIPKGLSINPKDKRLAVQVEDHPLDYINFEGIIPKGNYGAGSVEIFDQGNYSPLDDFDYGLKKGHIKFLLNGEKYKGGWSLIRTDNTNWLIVKSVDQYAGIEKIRNTKLPFTQCSVQLATLSKNIPEGPNWLFEIKYDGYRIVSYVEKQSVRMLTRNNIDYTKKFTDICNSLKKLDQDSFVVDGEIISLDQNGKSDFGLLQQNIKSGNNKFYYVLFDLLALNGDDLRGLSLLERKEKLELLLAKSDNNLIFSNHVINQGKECFNLAKEKRLEGIIAKKVYSKYSGKRNDDWLKIKCYLRQEFVIGGFTTSEKNEYLSAILVGYYDNDDLIFIGKVGTGFNENDKKFLNNKFKKYLAKESPFANNVKLNNIKWLKPELIAEIQYAELTKDHLLRQPSYIGLRQDKNPKDVNLEGLHETTY